MINVFCLCTGNKYKIEYVEKLKNMVKKNLTIEHKFICLTDRPNYYKIEGVEFKKAPISIPDSWCKLSLFAPLLEQYGYKGKSLFLDLDIVIVDNIDSLVQFNKDFTIIDDWNRDTFNSSVMLFEIGKHSKLFFNFNRSVMERLRGDQDWITEVLKKDGSEVKYFNKKHIRSYKANNMHNGIKESTKIVVFHGKPKPHECTENKWVKEFWV